MQGLAAFKRSIADTVSICPELEVLSQKLTTISSELDEASILLNHLEQQDEDPSERLEYCRSRISKILSLSRKYSREPEGLLLYYEKISEEVSQLELGFFDENALRKKLAEKEAELLPLEKKLTTARKKIAKRLVSKVEKELDSLKMKRACFVVSIESGKSSRFGADTVEFLLSANPGESPKPLSKIASGGELSRILLVLKSLAGGERDPMMLVFDEVDSGVGGEVAELVAEKLKKVSCSNQQVLVVTHAPQVAAYADNHLLLEKDVEGEATSVSVKQLSESERVGEIARMLAGKKVSKEFEASARELVCNANLSNISAVKH